MGATYFLTLGPRRPVRIEKRQREPWRTRHVSLGHLVGGEVCILQSELGAPNPMDRVIAAELFGDAVLEF